MSKINNKSEFIGSLSREQLGVGLIKFNIPDKDDIYASNGEGVWGWVSPEDKEKYNDDAYVGHIEATLLNQPLNDYGCLSWGDVVTLKCHGENRPTLDPEWVKETLLANV